MITEIAIERLHPHPDNPRKALGDLTELTESIMAHGVLQNLTVVPENEGYVVIIGHRRLEAAKLAGLTTLPCAESDMDHHTQVATMLTENVLRSDLTILEQARGIQMLLDLGETTQTIAKKTGFSETTVRKRLFVASLNTKKSEKAYALGATLEDYMKLQQINDKKKRDKALDSLGTNGFNQALNTALAEELRDKVAPEIISHIKEFARPTEKQSWELRGYGYSSSYDYESYKKDGKKSIKIPKTFEPDEYLYYIGLYRIEVYKRHGVQNDGKKMAELPLEEQKERREKRRKYKILQDMAGTSYQLRSEFVRSFSRKTITPAELETLASFAFAAVCLGERLGFSLYAKVEGLTVEDAYLLSFLQKKESVKAPATRILLSSLYSVFRDSAENRYHYATGETTAEKIGQYRANEKLDAIYDCLCGLGYVMSDEEQALRSGEHEAFGEIVEK